MDLRYGSNPDQLARATVGEPGAPVRVVSGHPSYINVLDAARLGAGQGGRHCSFSSSGDDLQACLTRWGCDGRRP